MNNPRQRAAVLLARVLQEKDTLASLPTPATPDEAQNVALIRELCLGVCRQYPQLQALLNALMDKSLKNKDSDVAALILIGLYQLYFMRVPDHAAINETVAGVRKPWARGLVNAVLRNALRRYPDFPNGFSDSLAFRLAHPEWLTTAIMNDWSDKTETILEANNQRAPLTLRVNLNKAERTEYLETLAQHGISAKPGLLTETAVILDPGHNVTRLPGFAEGLVSVQDEASQLVPLCLMLEPGLRVLDACAAPGGKTAAMLEHEPDLQLTATDNEERRLDRMRTNLDRLGLRRQVSLFSADASSPTAFSGLPMFDRILLDAPCSATGVIRRHPDIKLARLPAHIDLLVEKQKALLDSLWTFLRPGGLLLYTTCSLLKRENSDQIGHFLNSHADAEERPLPFSEGENCTTGRQLLPGSAGQDGFYYALLQKC